MFKNQKSFRLIVAVFSFVYFAFAISTSAQNAVQLGLEPAALKDLALTTNNSMRAVGFVPFGLFAACFIASVWEKHTFYPRWMMLFCPIFPMFFAGLITKNLSGEFKAIVGGGYFNLIFSVFFTASTIALAIHQKINVR